MAYRFASNLIIRATGSPVASFPMSMSAWFKVDVLNNNDTVFGIYVGGTATEFVELITRTSGMRFTRNSGGSNANATGTTPPLAGVWNHAAGVWSASNQADVYLNGSTTTASNTQTSVPVGMTTVGIGAADFASPSRELQNGEVGECSIFSGAFTLEDIDRLAAGTSPFALWRTGLELVFYSDLIVDLIDRIGALPFTNLGATAVPGPRVDSPYVPQQVPQFVAAPAPGGTPIHYHHRRRRAA